MLGETRRAARRAAVLAGMAIVSSCAAAPPATQLPTFAVAGTTTAAVAGAADTGVLPTDCERLLKVADLGALLGKPLDSVAVRSTVGVPAPSVGRTERLDCAYTATGPAGAALLNLNAAAYSDPASASAQWRLNAAAEDGERRDFPIGAASAVLVRRAQEMLLTVVYGAGTLTFVLPQPAQPANRAPGDVLVDMALRVLPAVPRVAPASTSPAPTPGPGSAQAAGTS